MCAGMSVCVSHFSIQSYIIKQYGLDNYTPLPQPLHLPLVIAVGKLWWSLKSQHFTINKREYCSTGDAWPIQTDQ